MAMTSRTYSTPREATVTGRTVSLTRLASYLLVAAFVLSAAYQLYRSTVMETPAYDRFDLPTLVMYGLLGGLSFAAGTGRRWGPLLVVFLSIAFTLMGIFYYYPVITPVRTFGPIDWAEGVLYCGLIFAAGVLSLCDLLGVALHPSGEGERTR